VILFTARWQRDPENFVVRAEGNEITLRQYQGDGATGLALGGTAYEDAVVLEVLIPKPASPLELIEVVAWSASEEKPEKSVKAPFDATSMRFRLENLREGEWRWKVRQLTAEKAEPDPAKPSKPLYVSAPGARPHFTVTRGITEPVARALAGPYLFAFEAVSLLLLAALVGAAFLARKEVRE